MHTGNNSFGNMSGSVEQINGISSGYNYGGNGITQRGNEMPEQLPSGRPSKNMAQAHFRVLRFYRRACRLLPFILRIHDLQTVVNPQQAMINVANIIRQKAYLREPEAVDRWVQRGYEQLMQAEWHMLNRDHLFQYLSNDRRGDQGYSYLEDVKFKGKSSFLKDFYTSKKSNEY